MTKQKSETGITIKSKRDVEFWKGQIKEAEKQIEASKDNPTFLTLANYDEIHNINKAIREFNDKHREKKQAYGNRAEEFLKKYPDHDYGMDYGELVDEIEKKIGKENIDKIPSKEFDDFVNELEWKMDAELPMINYRHDIAYDLTKGTLKVKDLPEGIKTIPQHPGGGKLAKKEIMDLFDVKLKSLLEKHNIEVKPSQLNAIKREASVYMHPDSGLESEPFIDDFEKEGFRFKKFDSDKNYLIGGADIIAEPNQKNARSKIEINKRTNSILVGTTKGKYDHEYREYAVLRNNEQESYDDAMNRFIEHLKEKNFRVKEINRIS